MDDADEFRSAPMDNSMSAAIERIALSLRQCGTKVVGFTAPRNGSGTTFCAQNTAALMAQAGCNTLYFDVSRRAPGGSQQHENWTTSHSNSRSMPKGDGAHFRYAAILACEGNRYEFQDPIRLRQDFQDNFTTYDAVIIDLPCIIEPPSGCFNPLPIASVCDGIVLVCSQGQHRTDELAESVNILKECEANVLGLVLNPHGYTSAGDEIARSCERFFWVVPGLARMVSRMARHSPLLQ